MPRRKVTKPITKEYADKLDNYIKYKLEPKLDREATFQDLIESMIKASTYQKVDDAYNVLAETWVKTGREIDNVEVIYKRYFLKNEKMEVKKSQNNNENTNHSEASKKKESKGCLLAAGLVFGISSISPLITLIFGGDPRGLEGVDYETGETYSVISNLRYSFIALIIALTYYLWAHYLNKTQE
ncbi:hypothetical protein [Tenacibaculum geojense]|uniref:Uncharacterized protein n=1 Tax=Tenacibaculum geojense TaxID=915352 RepID=A0ABW3JT88_9FLAO